VQQLGKLRIEMMRFLCGMGEQFCVTDLYRNANSFKGHRFLRTTFRIQRDTPRWPIYYCRCGELAVPDDSGGNFVGLAPAGPSRHITVCKLTERT
jgi:hypothetical protein